jgi:hypothetical protein
MEKKEILLPSKRHFKASEEDVTINVKLENDEALMREGERNIILDIPTLFDDERNESVNYKIHGKLKMVFRNMYSGYTEYTPLLRKLYLVGDGTGDDIGFMPYNELAFLRNDVYREMSTPASGTTIGLANVRPTINVTGLINNEHTVTTPIEAPYKNWNLYLTYVDSHDTGHTMTYTLSGATGATCDSVYNFCFKSGDGIPFRVTDNGNYYTLTSPVEHGISQGEYIILSGGTYTNYSGNTTGRTYYTLPITSATEKYRIYYVDSVGDEIYNSENYVINILKKEFISGTTLSSVVLGRRCKDLNNISGTTSEYYVHKHKTLTNTNDCILDKVGFENTIWEDERKILFENTLQDNDVLVERNRQETLLFDFKNSFQLTGITNNLGYTPTEVYTTIIFRNGNGFFEYPPKVGFKFNFHDSWIDNHFNGITSVEKVMTGFTSTFVSNSSGITFTGGTTIPIGTTGLTGAFVEYNKNEIKERIISESYHRFSHKKNIGNTSTQLFDHNQDETIVGNNVIPGFSGASINNQYGYYYQPHHRIKLRELSPYIETSRTNDVYSLPENVIFDENEKLWKWRDLYDHGFTDQDGNGTMFPFINNTHYVSSNINFYLRNEQTYFNKADGFIKFDNYGNKNKNNC